MTVVAVGALIGSGVPAVTAPRPSVPVTAGSSTAVSAAERSTAAQVTRLTAQARRLSAQSRAHSTALAAAALDAASAVHAPPSATAPETAPAELDTAVERLAGMVLASTAPARRAVRLVGDVPLVARELPPPDEAAAAPGDVMGQLALSDALAAAAAEVFRLSMQVESLSRAAAEQEVVEHAEQMVELERAAMAAHGAATALAEAAPLVPLPPTESPLTATADTLLAADAAVAVSRLRRPPPGGAAALATRWSNGAIPVEAMCRVAFAPDELLQCDAAAALSALNGAYRQAFGTDMVIVSSYRSLEAQVAVRAAKGSLAATPGRSNHGWGIAVDIGGIGGLGQFDAPGYLWLKEHAGAFGWEHPRAMEPGGGGPQEPWHWEHHADRGT